MLTEDLMEPIASDAELAKNPIQNQETLKAVIDKITFRDWTFFLGLKGETPYLQIQFWDLDFYKKKPALQKCRKWQLSYFMVNSEIVRTAFKATMTAMEHEVQETFTYDGVRVYHPHMDLDELVRLYKASKGKLISVRPDQNVIPKNEEPEPEPLVVEDETKTPSYHEIFHGKKA